MRGFLYWLYQPYKYFVFIPFLAATTAFLGPVAMLLTALFGPRVASRLCGTLWARLNSWATPMGVDVEGAENIDPKQSYVIVANHQSHYDVFVLYGWLGVDFKWVMKKELRRIPVLGIACEKLGHIYIDRSDPRSAVASLQAAKSRIVNGTSVLFFPEGTRSLTGHLGPFKKGAFQMALDLGLPILPVTIAGTRKILPPRTLDLFPGRARMRIHPPIDVSAYDPSRIDRLIARTREVIQSGLESEGAAACRTGAG